MRKYINIAITLCLLTFITGCGHGKLISESYENTTAKVVNLKHGKDPNGYVCYMDKDGNWHHDSKYGKGHHWCTIEYNGIYYQYNSQKIYETCENNEEVPITVRTYEYKDGKVETDIVVVGDTVIQGDGIKIKYRFEENTNGKS